MKAATAPRHGAKPRLLVIDERGRIFHGHTSDFASFLQRGDLIVANDAATIPASLHGTHVPTDRPIEVRLAGRRSLAARDVRRFTAAVFGDGDYRTPTENRPEPPSLNRGDELILGPLRATVLNVLGHPRLVEIQLKQSVGEIWEGIARHGRPIQYAYVPDPLAIWDTWTSIASRPVAFEAPSAGFALEWATLQTIRARGARFATITHAAGLSSTGDGQLDNLLPFDEPYDIPQATAALIRQTKRSGSRVIAVGTTVVRALEDSAVVHGSVAPGAGLATQRITPDSDLRVVDAIVSGLHERGSSHYDLLQAFQPDRALEQMTEEADARGYLAHEFGDAVFISRALAGPPEGARLRAKRFGEASPEPWRRRGHHAGDQGDGVIGSSSLRVI